MFLFNKHHTLLQILCISYLNFPKFKYKYFLNKWIYAYIHTRNTFTLSFNMEICMYIHNNNLNIIRGDGSPFLDFEFVSILKKLVNSSILAWNTARFLITILEGMAFLWDQYVASATVKAVTFISCSASTVKI